MNYSAIFGYYLYLIYTYTLASLFLVTGLFHGVIIVCLIVVVTLTSASGIFLGLIQLAVLTKPDLGGIKSTMDELSILVLFPASCMILLLYAGILLMIKKAAAYGTVWRLTLLGALIGFLMNQLYPSDGAITTIVVFVFLFLLSLPLRWLPRHSPATNR